MDHLPNLNLNLTPYQLGQLTRLCACLEEQNCTSPPLPSASLVVDVQAAQPPNQPDGIDGTSHSLRRRDSLSAAKTHREKLSGDESLVRRSPVNAETTKEIGRSGVAFGKEAPAVERRDLTETVERTKAHAHGPRAAFGSVKSSDKAAKERGVKRPPTEEAQSASCDAEKREPTEPFMAPSKNLLKSFIAASETLGGRTFNKQPTEYENHASNDNSMQSHRPTDESTQRDVLCSAVTGNAEGQNQESYSTGLATSAKTTHENADGSERRGLKRPAVAAGLGPLDLEKRDCNLWSGFPSTWDSIAGCWGGLSLFSHSKRQRTDAPLPKMVRDVRSEEEMPAASTIDYDSPDQRNSAELMAECAKQSKSNPDGNEHTASMSGVAAVATTASTIPPAGAFSNASNSVVAEEGKSACAEGIPTSLRSSSLRTRSGGITHTPRGPNCMYGKPDGTPEDVPRPRRPGGFRIQIRIPRADATSAAEPVGRTIHRQGHHSVDSDDTGSDGQNPASITDNDLGNVSTASKHSNAQRKLYASSGEEEKDCGWHNSSGDDEESGSPCSNIRWSGRVQSRKDYEESLEDGVWTGSDSQDLRTGIRIAVWWKGDDCYHPGIIEGYRQDERNKKVSFRVAYDDGDYEWLDLRKRAWILLAEKTESGYGQATTLESSPDSSVPRSQHSLTKPRKCKNVTVSEVDKENHYQACLEPTARSTDQTLVPVKVQEKTSSGIREVSIGFVIVSREATFASIRRSLHNQGVVPTGTNCEFLANWEWGAMTSAQEALMKLSNLDGVQAAKQTSILIRFSEQRESAGSPGKVLSCGMANL